MEGSQAQAPLGFPRRLASYGEEQEGRGNGSSSRYGEALGKPWLARAPSGAPSSLHPPRQDVAGTTCLGRALIHGGQL